MIHIQRALGLHVIDYTLKKKHHFVPNRFIYFRLVTLFKALATIWNESKSFFAPTVSF